MYTVQLLAIKVSCVECHLRRKGSKYSSVEIEIDSVHGIWGQAGHCPFPYLNSIKDLTIIEIACISTFNSRIRLIFLNISNGTKKHNVLTSLVTVAPNLVETRSQSIRARCFGCPIMRT